MSEYLSFIIFRRAALFNARECTVIPSGLSFFASSIEYLTIFSSSCGSPRIKSIFILLKPHCLASLNASLTCSTVCRLPIISKVFWFIVWGLIEILETLCFFNVLSFSSVILSGRPASTVNSLTVLKSKFSLRLVINLSIWSGSNVVGVPPPIYTVLSSRPFNCSPKNLISFMTLST